MKEHIVSTYDDDLNTLKTKLLEMGVLVERQIFQAIEVTKIINLSKAKEIQKGDDAIDALEAEIREFATKTLTKRQPLEIFCNFFRYVFLKSSKEALFISDKPLLAIDSPNWVTKGNSPAPITCGWDDIICSTRVVPERGIPTIKTGICFFSKLSFSSEFFSICR